MSNTGKCFPYRSKNGKLNIILALIRFPQSLGKNKPGVLHDSRSSRREVGSKEFQKACEGSMFEQGWNETLGLCSLGIKPMALALLAPCSTKYRLQECNLNS